MTPNGSLRLSALLCVTAVVWCNCRPRLYARASQPTRRFDNQSDDNDDVDDEQVATDCTLMIDHLRHMPALEQLSLSTYDGGYTGLFVTSNYSHEHDRAPRNVTFCRALRTKLERLITRVTNKSHSLGSGGETHDVLIQRALEIIAPNIRHLVSTG